MIIGLTITSIIVLLLLGLWHSSRALYWPPKEAKDLATPRWTREQILEAYRKTEGPVPSATNLLPKRQGRRYIIVGGSGT